MKKSAVEWLVEQILVKFEDHMNEDYEMDFSKPPNVKFYNAFIDSTDLSEYVNKAKQIEQEQIEEAFNNSYWFIDGREYYEKTYGIYGKK